MLGATLILLTPLLCPSFFLPLHFSFPLHHLTQTSSPSSPMPVLTSISGLVRRCPDWRHQPCSGTGDTGKLVLSQGGSELKVVLLKGFRCPRGNEGPRGSCTLCCCPSMGRFPKAPFLSQALGNQTLPTEARVKYSLCSPAFQGCSLESDAVCLQEHHLC